MSDSPFKQRLLREAAEDFSYSLGNGALAKNALDEAVILFKRALDVRSDNGKALHNLALALERLNRTDEAAACTAAAPNVPDYVQARCDLAQTYEIQGQGEAAASAYGDALSAMPGHVEANFRIGLLLMSLDHSAEAVSHFRRLLGVGKSELAPLGPTQLACVGRHLATAGEYRDAESLLQIALALDPASVAANVAFATLLPTLGRFEDAVSVWQRVVQLAPQVIPYWVFLAEALFAVDRLADAEQACLHALATDAKQARKNNALLQLGKIKLYQGNFAEAETWLNQALAENPAPQIGAFIQDSLGSINFAQGRFDQAAAFQQTALTLAPNMVGAKIRLGLTRLAQGRVAEALALHRDCVDAHPGNDYFVSCLGLSLHLAGCLDEAIATHRRAIEIEGRAAWQWDNLGLALMAAGQREQALDAHRQAIRCQPNRVRIEARMRPWATSALLDVYRELGLPE